MMNTTLRVRDCQAPEDVPSDYCRKLKQGIARLEAALRTHYETVYPTARDLISRAIREAEEASWETPFPSLFFPALAHLKMREMIPSA